MFDHATFAVCLMVRSPYEKSFYSNVGLLEQLLFHVLYAASVCKSASSIFRRNALYYYEFCKNVLKLVKCFKHIMMCHNE